MVIIQNPKSISYWYVDKTDMGKGVFMSVSVPKNKKYVKVVSEKFPDNTYISKISYGKKMIVLKDDGVTCKSGYQYTYNIQKVVYKLLGMTFPKTSYEEMFRDTYKKLKRKGVCE